MHSFIHVCQLQTLCDLSYSFFFLRDAIFTQKGSRSYLNQEEVDNMEETEVETVPPTPIAPVKYLVSYNEKDPLSSVSELGSQSTM